MRSRLCAHNGRVMPSRSRLSLPRADATSILPIIAAKTSPSIILPTMDLKFHVLDVFIKSLHSWIDSNRRLASIFSLYKYYRSFPLVFSMFPCPEYCIGSLLLFIRHTGIERLERRDELLQLI